MSISSMLTESMLTTAEAARRLGVKPETLYAYVSRGMLTRHPAPGGRRSLFARAEVERLAGRARRGGRARARGAGGGTPRPLARPAGGPPSPRPAAPPRGPPSPRRGG